MLKTNKLQGKENKNKTAKTVSVHINSLFVEEK